MTLQTSAFCVLLGRLGGAQKTLKSHFFSGNTVIPGNKRGVCLKKIPEMLVCSQQSLDLMHSSWQKRYGRFPKESDVGISGVSYFPSGCVL